MNDAAQLVAMSLKKLEEKWPGICNAVSSAMVQKDTPEGPQQACQRCPCILSRISAIPGFDAPYPSRAIHEFRAEVDKVVRETTGDIWLLQRVWGTRLGDCGGLLQVKTL